MIREATDKDAERLAEMGAAFFAEAGLPDRGVSFDVESFLTFCGGLARVGILLVVEKEGRAVGMMGVAIMPAFWNVRVRLAHECFLWVDPGHRDGVAGRLLSEVERRAAGMGASLCAMVAEHGLRGKAVGRLYEAKGFAPAESTYWKRLNAA